MLHYWSFVFFQWYHYLLSDWLLAMHPWSGDQLHYTYCHVWVSLQDPAAEAQASCKPCREPCVESPSIQASTYLIFLRICCLIFYFVSISACQPPGAEEWSWRLHLALGAYKHVWCHSQCWHPPCSILQPCLVTYWISSIQSTVCEWVGSWVLRCLYWHTHWSRHEWKLRAETDWWRLS